MNSACPFSQKPLVQIVSLALVALAASAQPSWAQSVDLGTVGGSSGAGAATTTTITAARGTAASVAPSQANLSATQPQSIISRSYIEESTPPTGNFNTILSIAPSVASTPAFNGPGLSDQKMSLRGFQDGEYNVTFDGIPFGDSNGPTHHSTSYFPAAVIGGMVIERGPGNASNIGYSTYGGSVNIFSKAPSQTEGTSVFGSIGTWGTQLEGVSYESGRLKGSDATLQISAQHMQSNGYLTGAGINQNNLTVKYQRPVGDSSLLTLFASPQAVTTYNPDNVSGVTMAQAVAFGKNYYMNNNPKSQEYAGYAPQNKTTDTEYVRLQSDWGNGWQTDNNSYTYAYTNNTLAAQNPVAYGVGTTAENLTFANNAKVNVTLPNGDVPGYLKLNEYRVYGDVFKATQKIGSDLLRVGVWWEFSRTERHNLEADITGNSPTVLPGYTTGQPAGVVTSSNFAQQYSHWHQYQPFIEYEWAAAPGMTVTPGYKLMYYGMDLGSASNQKVLAPQYYAYKYNASLPFLTVNQRLDAQNSVYAQYATGMELPPTFGIGSTTGGAPAPQTTTNYQFGAVHKSDKLTMDADLYYIDMNNMQFNTGTNANPNWINVGGGIYKGLEGEATYMVADGWAAYGNFGLNNGAYKNSNAAVGQPTGVIPNVPNITTGAGALYNLGPWNASLLFKRIGNQFNSKIGGTLPYIDNTDLNISYKFSNVSALGAKNYKLQFSIFNLTNRQNLIAASGPLNSASTQYQWQAPRSFMLSGKADF